MLPEDHVCTEIWVGEETRAFFRLPVTQPKVQSCECTHCSKVINSSQSVHQLSSLFGWWPHGFYWSSNPNWHLFCQRDCGCSSYVRPFSTMPLLWQPSTTQLSPHWLLLCYGMWHKLFGCHFKYFYTLLLHSVKKICEWGVSVSLTKTQVSANKTPGLLFIVFLFSESHS